MGRTQGFARRNCNEGIAFKKLSHLKTNIKFTTVKIHKMTTWGTPATPYRIAVDLHLKRIQQMTIIRFNILCETLYVRYNTNLAV